MNSAVEIISCTSGDDCNEYPSAKRRKLTLDEILTGEGFKIIPKAAQHMSSASAGTTQEADSWTTKNLFKMCQ